MAGMHAAAVAGADVPSQTPFERWSMERAYSPEVAIDKVYVRQAGFLTGVQNFDAAAFRSPSQPACWSSEF